MEQLIAKMRADFALVAEERRGRGDWDEAMERDIGLAIKAAIDGKDVEMIACWAAWLADLAAQITAFSLIVRKSESRMREMAREERAKRESAGKGGARG